MHGSTFICSGRLRCYVADGRCQRGRVSPEKCGKYGGYLDAKCYISHLLEEFSNAYIGCTTFTFHKFCNALIVLNNLSAGERCSCARNGFRNHKIWSKFRKNVTKLRIIILRSC